MMNYRDWCKFSEFKSSNQYDDVGEFSEDEEVAINTTSFFLGMDTQSQHRHAGSRDQDDDYESLDCVLDPPEEPVQFISKTTTRAKNMCLTMDPALVETCYGSSHIVEVCSHHCWESLSNHSMLMDGNRIKSHSEGNRCTCHMFRQQDTACHHGRNIGSFIDNVEWNMSVMMTNASSRARNLACQGIHDSPMTFNTLQSTLNQDDAICNCALDDNDCFHQEWNSPTNQNRIRKRGPSQISSSSSSPCPDVPENEKKYPRHTRHVSSSSLSFSQDETFSSHPSHQLDDSTSKSFIFTNTSHILSGSYSLLGNSFF